MALPELPESERACDNCEQYMCGKAPTKGLDACLIWCESYASKLVRAEACIAELERERDAARTLADGLRNVATERGEHRDALQERVKELEETLGGYKIIHLDQADQIDSLIHEREDQRDRAEKAERDVHRWKREARVLRNIVQEDHPDELQVLRGMRTYHARERRRRREAEARVKELRAEYAAQHDAFVKHMELAVRRGEELRAADNRIADLVRERDALKAEIERLQKGGA